MYASGDKLSRERSRKTQKNPPSFSSTLLDEIYRSIDGNSFDKSDDVRRHVYKEKTNPRRHEEMASYRRAGLVEKWMEKEAPHEKALALAMAKKRQQELDNEFVFFSSTSSSSDSSGALSSSDTEFFSSSSAAAARSSKSPKVISCFAARPKPIRAVDDDLIKSKSRALKIYSSLKKVKQPISPGGRLTTFINSLFTNAGAKKSRNPDAPRHTGPPHTRDVGPSAACSSASSFSRSCLSKYSPGSREKMRSNGEERRTVRFEPVCSSARFGRPPVGLPELKLNKKVEIPARDNNKSDRVYYNRDHQYENEDEDDCLSDSSLDLFELDHQALFGGNKYNEELPVYKTTHFNTLIR